MMEEEVSHRCTALLLEEEGEVAGSAWLCSTLFSKLDFRYSSLNPCYWA